MTQNNKNNIKNEGQGFANTSLSEVLTPIIFIIVAFIVMYFVSRYIG